MEKKLKDWSIQNVNLEHVSLHRRLSCHMLTYYTKKQNNKKTPISDSLLKALLRNATTF